MASSRKKDSRSGRSGLSPTAGNRRNRGLRLEPLEERQLLSSVPVLLGVNAQRPLDPVAVKAAPQQIDTSVFFIDDNANLGTGTVTVSYPAGATANEKLTVNNVGDITLVGSDVNYDFGAGGGGVKKIGEIDATDDGDSGAPLEIDLTADATPEAVDALIEALAYQYTGAGDPPDTQTVRLAVNDGSDGASAPRSVTLFMPGPSTRDYGDAPDVYRVSAGVAEDASHTATGPMLGTRDAESAANPSAGADGDDTAGTDDEDGVSFPLVSGGQFQIRQGNWTTATVTASGPGQLRGWIDFNADGAWTSSERIISQSLVAGDNTVVFFVPADAEIGDTYARFRFSTVAAATPFGAAADGEVEDYRLSIVAGVAEEFDFGDAPSNRYPTLGEDNGARHLIAAGPTLGAAPDAESNAQDDDGADEDGVTFPAVLMVGESATISVSNVGAGLLSAWIDFNGDGDWGDAGEQIFNDQVLTELAPGEVHTFQVSVPDAGFEGETYARFRISTAGGLSPTGRAENGEVEDYEVTIEKPLLDFGDADSTTYPTLRADNGARHIAVGPRLGNARDVETDGQASDDLDLDGDDEDGVVFATPIIPSQEATITVSVTGAPGKLNAWIDYNNDGDWDDAGEQVFTDQDVALGANSLTFTVLSTSATGQLASRFRLSTTTGLGTTGLATDGEVEDYLITVSPLVLEWDFGDAPDQAAGPERSEDAYPTLEENDGARHAPAGPMLGTRRDVETDGQPNANALGDDTAGSQDDEDGVTFAASLAPGQQATVVVNASAAARLDAWIDFDQQGGWEADEKIFDNVAIVAGDNELTFMVPAGAEQGATYARFRVSTTGGLSPTGAALDGEVEDYRVNVGTAAIEEDFNDGNDGPFTPRTGNWSVVGQEYFAQRQAGSSTVISTLQTDEALPENLDVRVTFNADPATATRWSNAFIIFDYNSPTDFKFAGAFVGINRWVIGHMTDRGYKIDSSFRQQINAGTDYDVQVLLEGNRVTLRSRTSPSSSYETKTSFIFDSVDDFTGGQLGLATLRASTRFDDFSASEIV